MSTWASVNSVRLNRPQRAFRYADFGARDLYTIFLESKGAWFV